MNEPTTETITSTGKPVAVVTGASAGIGEATVRALTHEGFEVIFGARRLERLERLAEETGGRAVPLDVTDPESIERFAAQVPTAHLLVNNAGGAFGLEPIDGTDLSRWQAMYEVNVLGLARMTQALLPALRASGDGLVVNIGSIAGFETYSGGAGYTGVKHAVRALTRTLRLELLGEPIRVTEICPGLVETEFSIVRLGDRDKAEAVYKDMTPLVAEDIANAIAWVATRPSHVNIDELVIRPRDQATAHHVHRRSD